MTAQVNGFVNQSTHQPLLVVISGPSGIGKDAVVNQLKEKYPEMHFVVTATSRQPRAHEVHGVDYFFVSTDEFEKMIANQELLEYAKVYSDYKGIPRSQVKQALESGKDVVMRLDVQGASTVRRLCPDAILIFLTAATEAEWIERLRGRRADSEAEMALRIATAHNEYQSLDKFDYIVLNADGQLDAAVDQVMKIIEVEHLRTHPRKVNL